MSDHSSPRPGFVRCVNNEGHEVDLEVGNWYRVLPDPEWERRGFIRVIDESEEDYVFGRRCFDLPELKQEQDSEGTT